VPPRIEWFTGGRDGEVRLVNATQNASLGLALNGSATVTGVAAGSASGYMAETTGSYATTVSAADGSIAATTVSESLGAVPYTVLASGRDGAIRQNLLADTQVAPAAGYTSLTVSNLSLDAGPLDIYVVAPATTTLSGQTPYFQAVNYGTLANPQLVVAGTYTVIATASGNQNDVRMTLASLAFSGSEILTLALTGTTGGALVNGVLIQQGGPVQIAPATNARVRVVAAFPSSSTVTATVGTALADVASPSVGSYTLVPGASTISAISVSGTPVAILPTTTFAAGGDYTILVYGPAGAPLATVLTDVNQTLGSDTVLRLVNAAVSGGVTLTVDAAPVANNVAFGFASAYVGVPPPPASSVQVSSAGSTINCSNCSGVNLTSGGVYTYFVLDSASSTPEVMLSRDR